MSINLDFDPANTLLILDRVVTSDLAKEGRQTRNLAVKCVIICIETDRTL